MPSSIDVRALTERVHLRLQLQLQDADADVSAELDTADARTLAERLVAAADRADRRQSVGELVASLA